MLRVRDTKQKAKITPPSHSFLQDSKENEKFLFPILRHFHKDFPYKCVIVENFDCFPQGSTTYIVQNMQKFLSSDNIIPRTDPSIT